MKKLNILLGILAGIVFFFGNYFKIQHWPGASILMMCGALLGIVFLLMYLFGGNANLSAGMEKNNSVIGSITMIIVLVGFVFKIMHWPGANVMAYLGHAGLLIFGITLFIDAFKEGNANKQSIKIFAAFTVFILMSILVLLGMGSLMNP